MYIYLLVWTKAQPLKEWTVDVHFDFIVEHWSKTFNLLTNLITFAIWYVQNLLLDKIALEPQNLCFKACLVLSDFLSWEFIFNFCTSVQWWRESERAAHSYIYRYISFIFNSINQQFVTFCLLQENWKCQSSCVKSNQSNQNAHGASDMNAIQQRQVSRIYCLIRMVACNCFIYFMIFNW